MKQPIEVVMLPTEDKTSLIINNHLATKSNLEYRPDLLKASAIIRSAITYQHLYITISQSVEPIKLGDAYFRPSLNEVFRGSGWEKGDLKVIASSEEKLGNTPQVQQSFLKEFVKNPNGKWEVDYFEHNHPDLGIVDCTLKINSDNTVNITSVEEKMYSTAETISKVLKMQHDYTKYRESCHYSPNMREIAEWTNNWIKENLK